MSATSSPGTSPSKPNAKSQLPASIANASLEELQKLFVDSLKKLKARDKRITELSANQESLQTQLTKAQSSESSTADSARQELEQSLQSAQEEATEATRRAEDAEQQFESLYKSHAAQQQSLEDAAAEKAMHAEQMTSLKEVLRSLAQEKELAEKVLTTSPCVLLSSSVQCTSLIMFVHCTLCLHSTEGIAPKAYTQHMPCVSI